MTDTRLVLSEFPGTVEDKRPLPRGQAKFRTLQIITSNCFAKDSRALPRGQAKFRTLQIITSNFFAMESRALTCGGTDRQT
jgi:hypothetical protein